MKLLIMWYPKLPTYFAPPTEFLVFKNL